ncbi:MAG: acyltransferase, partial [Acidimicrobiia bacterium]
MTSAGDEARVTSVHPHADRLAGTTALPEYVPALDGIRGFAVIATVLVHLRPGLIPNFHDVANYLGGGALGVDMFFVLSGFLISSILLRERTRSDELNFKPFYLRRVTRLLPALIAFLLVYFAYGVLTHQSKLVAGVTVITGFTYSTNWYLAFHHAADFLTMSHLWTLALEEQFYLVWPATFMLLLLSRRPVRNTLWFCTAATVAVWLLRINDWSSWYTTLHHGAVEVSGTLHASSFLIGAAAAIVGTRPFAGTRFLPIAATIACGVMAWIYAVGDSYSKLVNYGGLELFAACVAIIILAIVEQRWIGSKFWALKPLRVTGRVSYGIYLWHPLVFTAVLRYTPTWTWYSRLVLSAVLIASVTAWSWYFVEQPAQRLRRRLTARSAGLSVPARSSPRDPKDDRTRGFKVLATGLTLVAISIAIAYALPEYENTAAAAGTAGGSTGPGNRQGPAGTQAQDAKGLLRMLVAGDSTVIDLIRNSDRRYETANVRGLATSFYGCGIADAASLVGGKVTPFPTTCGGLNDSFRRNSTAFAPDVAVLVTGSAEGR